MHEVLERAAIEAGVENRFDFEMFITIKEVRGRAEEVGAMGVSFAIGR
jgi:hypothetical protein